jgi:hypothetical protein
MKSILKRLKNRLLTLFLSEQRSNAHGKIVKNLSTSAVSARSRGNGFKGKDLLPQHKPLLASLRPGLQHCQIHDPKYLSQILEAELNSEPPPPPADGSTDA